MILSRKIKVELSAPIYTGSNIYLTNLQLYSNPFPSHCVSQKGSKLTRLVFRGTLVVDVCCIQ